MLNKLNTIGISLVCFVIANTTAQVTDTPNNTLRIPAEPSEIKIDSSLIKIATDFDKKQENTDSKSNVGQRESKPFSMLYDDGLKNSGEIFEQRWKKEAAKGGIIKTMSDQFLGEHNVDTKFVNIVCRDHQHPDGDRVQIRVNDNIVTHNLLLTNQYRRVEVNLSKGRNIVEIEALNQGESGPNTAEFVVYDDNGHVISSKEWNLLTGVKARIVFVNEEVIIKPKTSSENSTTTR